MATLTYYIYEGVLIGTAGGETVHIPPQAMGPGAPTVAIPPQPKP